MLTVREALELPSFASAEIVAGWAGLDNQIRSVHIVDTPDSSYDWGRDGVLLLTAGFGLQNAPERQSMLIPKLVDRKFAGLVLSTGYYFKETPLVIRETADSFNFPVIETPRGVLFIDLTEAIFEQIVNRQYALLQQSAQIHKQLTDLVLRGGDLDDLITTLANLLERSVVLEDTSFQVLATAHQGPVDEARQRSVVHGYTTPEVAQRLIDGGVYDRLLEKMVPIHVAPMPDLGMFLRRLVVPIIVDREVYGYIWIIVGDRPLTELNELAIHHGATVAALIMLKEQAVREAQEAMRGDFLEQLLRGAKETAVFTEQARQLKYRLDQPHQVLLIQDKPKAGGNPHSLLDALEYWLREQNCQALLDRRDEGVVLIIESDDTAKGKELAVTLVEDLNQAAHELLVGVGHACQPRKLDLDGVRRSYEEAREVVRISTVLGRRKGVTVFGELGLLHWLYHLPPEQQADNAYLQHVLTLAAYDTKHKTELVKTLEVYLDSGGSLVEAAAALYIHRNTLLHRLDRIEQLCAVHLRDPLERLNLHTAIKSYRLHGEQANI